MNQKNRERLARQAKTFKALGHPVRLAMVEKIAGGECCVCELVELVGLDFSTVSRHLAILKEAGIAKDDKRGQKVFYSLETPCVMNFINCLETASKS